MTSWIVGAVVVLWLACGVLSAGYHYAYFQREWPSLARRNERYNFYDALFGVLFGPCSLAATLEVCGRKHGWTLRRPNKTWRALNDAVLGDDD